MADKPEAAHAVYLERKHGWFWVVPQGQRAIYHGPYGTQQMAETYQEDLDAYAAYREVLRRGE